MGEDVFELGGQDTEKGNKQDRGWAGYRNYLQFPNDFFFRLFLGGTASAKNKVLDVGGGKGRFARECSSQHPNAEVITVEPQYRNPDYLAGTTGNNEAAAAVWSALPFRNDSFDRVVSAGAFPLWCKKEDWPTALAEITRVLKPGGQARFKLPGRVLEFKALLGSSGLECHYQRGVVMMTKGTDQSSRMV